MSRAVERGDWRGLLLGWGDEGCSRSWRGTKCYCGIVATAYVVGREAVNARVCGMPVLWRSLLILRVNTEDRKIREKKGQHVLSCRKRVMLKWSAKWGDEKEDVSVLILVRTNNEEKKGDGYQPRSRAYKAA